MLEELEWKTRKERIDKKLKALKPGWNIIKYEEGTDTSTLLCHAITEYPTENGPADYAFFVKGKLLGILEAKKVGVNPQNVLEQAKRYSRGASNGTGNWDGYRVTFLYSSNGEIIWFLDVRDSKNIRRQISHFHTADALEELSKNDKAQGFEWLKENPIDIEKLRYYQKEAIESTEKAIIQHKRAMLVAMATGTGKTYTTVAQIYRLLQSKAARKILFLVDRRVLAAQAVREFASFNTPTCYFITRNSFSFERCISRYDNGKSKSEAFQRNADFTSPSSRTARNRPAG